MIKPSLEDLSKLMQMLQNMGISMPGNQEASETPVSDESSKALQSLSSKNIGAESLDVTTQDFHHKRSCLAESSSIPFSFTPTLYIPDSLSPSLPSLVYPGYY